MVNRKRRIVAILVMAAVIAILVLISERHRPVRPIVVKERFRNPATAPDYHYWFNGRTYEGRWHQPDRADVFPIREG